MATPLSLSLAELARLEAVQKVFLTPFDYPSVDHWRAAANAGARELLRAGVAAFALPPVPGRAMCFSNELSPEAKAVFDAMFLNDAARERALVNRLAVWNQTAIIAGDWDVYNRDPVVNEFLKPNGLLDAAGFMIDWPREEAYASLAVYGDRYGIELMGERGVRMLRILLPAFKAGVRTIVRSGEHHPFIAGALDALGQALQVRAPDGRVLHETPAFARLVAADGEPNRLRAETERVGRAASVVVSRRTKAHRGEPGGAAYRHVHTATARYRVRAVAVLGRVIDIGPAVVVTLERVTSQPVSDRELQDLYSLTPREVQVARLMATGMSNSEIAQQLSTSVHTTRRQSERVLAKLGIHRRAGVAAKLHTP